MSLSTNNSVRSMVLTQSFRPMNAVCLLIFTGMTCVGVWGAMDDGSSRCRQWEDVFMIVCGVFLMGISLLGLADVRKKPYLLSLFLLMLLVFIIVLIIIAIFAFVVTANGAGKEYKLGDYSPWMRKRISNWNNVKNKCLHSNGFCFNYNRDLEVIQDGCCKPPSECNFVNQSPMVWNKPMTTKGNYSNNPDCGAWDNDPKVWCFNCDSCKAGFLEDMKTALSSWAILIVFSLVPFVMWYAIGVINFKENWRVSFTLPC